MADDMQRLSLPERDVEQAITALKRGAHLLKYGRRGKPKFCPFRLSSDESTLIWFDGNEEKQLELCLVSKIIPGQRTAIFKRYPRLEKEYQSFSLLYDDRSLDLICKDKDEAEIWFSGLKALIARNSDNKQRNDSRSESVSSYGTRRRRRTTSSLSFFSPDRGDTQGSDNSLRSRLGKVFADVVSLTAASRNSQSEPVACFASGGGAESLNVQTSGAVGFRASHSSAMSLSSRSSCIEDYNKLGDVYVWGEGTGDGVMGGSPVRADCSSNTKIANGLLPKLLESTMALDVQTVACSQRQVILVLKQGEVFSWGEEGGVKLGQCVTTNASQPKLIEGLTGKSVETVVCGPYHTCAVTACGEVYTWGGSGSLYSGLLGHGSEATHWNPKRVDRPLEGLQVSAAACGPWHTAFLTSAGRLFTFGDGTFGALGHGDRCNVSVPREVEALKDLKTIKVACGAWHTAALVEIASESSEAEGPKQTPFGKMFTWGNGDKGQLGHGNYESKLAPDLISLLADINFSRVACGDDFTVALTTSGQAYTMGSITALPDGNVSVPSHIKANSWDVCAEEVACGSHHAAILTSRGEVYTWGKGAHGQLGHGDNEDRSTPTLIFFFKDKQVKSIACGTNITAAVCLHKGISSADNSLCSGCHNPFTFIRKRHNCYNCGLGFCKVCSSRKSVKASLAPSRSKAYRVCDDCFVRLQRATDSASISRIPAVKSEGLLSKSGEDRESGGLQLSGIISRLSSAESFKSDRSTTFSIKLDSNENRVFPLHDGSNHRQSTSSLSPGSPPGSLQRRSTSSLSPSSPSGSLQNSCPVFPLNSKSVSQLPSPAPGKSPWKSTSLSQSSSSILLLSSKNFRRFSLPDTKSLSQLPSPVPGKSPWRSTTPSPSSSSLLSFASEPTIDDIKSSNYSLSLEAKSLRAQVEKLTSKSRHLEAELERNWEQLKEATMRAAEEAGKHKAAKEVIKFLTTQLREMAERVPEEQVTSSHMDINERTTNINSCSTNGYHVTWTDSPNSTSNGSSTPLSLSNGTRAQAHKSESSTPLPLSNGTRAQAHTSESSTLLPLSNGTRAQAHKSERTMQDEPGVYVTIVTLPNGVKELRRIRFSRKLFTEAEAEKWWTENGTKLCQRHNVRLQDGSDS